MISKKELQLQSKLNLKKKQTVEQKVKADKAQKLDRVIKDTIRALEKNMLTAAAKGEFSAEVQVTEETKYVVSNHFRKQGYTIHCAGDGRTTVVIVKWEE